jgi:hypothetical protein
MMTKFKLCPLGQFTAATVNDKQPSSFYITAHLKEAVNTVVLQRAVNDVMTRLPFLSGRLKKGFFLYSQELLPPPNIVPIGTPHQFHQYYNEGLGHSLRVLYGERSFTVETIHNVVDGRGLLKTTQTLLVRYFELLGMAFDKTGMIDCSAQPQPEEAESGYERYYDPKKKQPKQLTIDRAKAYQLGRTKGLPTRVISQNYDMTLLKHAAKTLRCTMTEYILAHIFLEFRAYRNKSGNQKPITSLMAVDLRSFFPTATLRNFVGNATITMPETDDFSQMIAGLRTQFAALDKNFGQGGINEMQGLIHASRVVPFAIKKRVIQYFEHKESKGISTIISNLGKIVLPPEIEQRLENLEFVIDLSQDTTSFFSCITMGNVLTLAATAASDEAQQFAQDVMQRLERVTQNN